MSHIEQSNINLTQKNARLEAKIVLQVRDSGEGITDENQKKLFQPFFTTKPVGEGTGLGLSIVKGILDDHSATVELLHKELDTCFEIRFKKQGSNHYAA